MIRVTFHLRELFLAIKITRFYICITSSKFYTSTLLCPYFEKKHLLHEFFGSATDIILITCEKSLKNRLIEVRVKNFHEQHEHAFIFMSSVS